MMKDFGFNMKKKNGVDYKENVIKTIWNRLWWQRFCRKNIRKKTMWCLIRFQKIIFASARKVRDAKGIANEFRKTKNFLVEFNVGRNEQNTRPMERTPRVDCKKNFTYHIASCMS